MRIGAFHQHVEPSAQQAALIRAAATRSPGSRSRSRRSCMTADGTASGNSAAGVPARALYEKRCILAKPTSRTTRQRRLEVRVRLAGEADDDVGRERRRVERLPQAAAALEKPAAV